MRLTQRTQTQTKKRKRMKLEYSRNFLKRNFLKCSTKQHCLFFFFIFILSLYTKMQFHFNTPAQHEVYRHAKAGNILQVKYWLEEKHYPVDKKDFYSNSVLYYACLCNHPPLVSYIIARGAEFSNRSEDGHRTFLASSNQDIRNILLGRHLVEKEVYVEPWFSTILKHDSFSDVTFTVSGKSIPAHKCILAARCPNLIPKLEMQNKISMGSSITEVIMSLFLEYAYTDKAAIKENKKTLYQMAKKLNFTTLENACSNSDKDPSLSISNDMKTMYNNPLFSDIILTAEDGPSLHAHKVILATRCDYFKTLFSSAYVDSCKDKLQLNEVPYDVLSIIVQYIYSGQIENKDILDVLVASDQFLLPKLKQELEMEILKNYLDVDCCVDLAITSYTLCCNRLYKACTKMISNNIASLIKTNSLLNLPQEIKNDIYGFKNYDNNELLELLKINEM